MSLKRHGPVPRPPEQRRIERVAVLLTPAQLAALDSARGHESRSSYLARRADLTHKEPA